MATRYTIGAGAVTDVSKWDGGTTLPVAVDAVQIKHAMTIGTGKTFPDAGTDPFLSIDFNNGGSGALAVTGTVTIRGTTITNFKTVNDTAATNLLVVGEVSAGGTWTCNSPTATPTQITGNLTVTGQLGVANACRLVVTGNASGAGISGGQQGVYVRGSSASVGSMSVGGTLTATSALSIGVQVAGTLTALVCNGTSATSSIGIYVNSAYSPYIAGPGPPAGCVITGAATTTGKGVSATYGKLVGTFLGTCGAGGYGVLCGGSGYLWGDILISSDPTSALIGIQAGGVFYDITGTGPGRILAKSGNTIQFADAQEFCPTANVAVAGDVRLSTPRYTGGTNGTMRPAGVFVNPGLSGGLR